MQEEGNDEISGIVESKVSRMEADCKFARRIQISRRIHSPIANRYDRKNIVFFGEISFRRIPSLFSCHSFPRHSALEQFESLPSITVGMSKRKMEESS